jgi:hypothetical protein
MSDDQSAAEQRAAVRDRYGLGPCTRPGCLSLALWLYTGYDKDREPAAVCDSCYKAEEFYPGHVRTGDGMHFMGCNDCDARRMGNVTLERAESMYHQGMITQDTYEAFCHVWATASFRYSSAGSWSLSPAIPEVVRLVAIMRGGLALRVTAESAMREVCRG